MGRPYVFGHSKKTYMNTLHTELHDIADQFYLYYGAAEGKERYQMSFGLFLGLLKRKGTQWGYEKLSEAKDYQRRERKLFPIQFLMK